MHDVNLHCTAVRAAAVSYWQLSCVCRIASSSHSQFSFQKFSSKILMTKIVKPYPMTLLSVLIFCRQKMASDKMIINVNLSKSLLLLLMISLIDRRKFANVLFVSL